MYHSTRLNVINTWIDSYFEISKPVKVSQYARITNQKFIPVIRRPCFTLADKAWNTCLAGRANHSNRNRQLVASCRACWYACQNIIGASPVWAVLPCPSA